jgi:phenylacetate-CoA ligase
MINPIEALAAYNLLRSKGKSPEEIKHIQEQKLHKLIKHAYEKVPYYHQLFDTNGLKPEDIQTIDDLRKIPFYTKEIARSFPLEYITAKGLDISKCRIGYTAGSTSIPMKVYYNWRDARMIGIALVRNFLAFGVKSYYRAAEFFMNEGYTRKRGMFDRIGIWRSWKFSPWEEPEPLLQKLKIWKPQVIYGYFMTLKLLAETILKKEIKGIAARVVISSAGILDEQTREQVKNAFNAQVFDYYGSWEGGNIAWECPICEGYHINTDMVIVELLKDGRPAAPGEEGEVVLTNLYSHAMPFIRYSQRDVATLSPDKPKCGTPFPLIKQISGRFIDFIILPSGKRISPLPIMSVMVKAPKVNQFRIIQDEINHLSVEIVACKDFNQSHRTEIEQRLKNVIGSDIKIDIESVKQIEFPPSRKRRLIYSKVLEKEENRAAEQ